jgi:hypothetical protein
MRQPLRSPPSAAGFQTAVIFTQRFGPDVASVARFEFTRNYPPWEGLTHRSFRRMQPVLFCGAVLPMSIGYCVHPRIATASL